MNNWDSQTVREKIELDASVAAVLGMLQEKARDIADRMTRVLDSWDGSADDLRMLASTYASLANVIVKNGQGLIDAMATISVIIEDFEEMS